ncbi:MAG TPA: hypothetical protein VHY33_15545 [Thermoanaerobaculia bacterium]|nr:hypothetical protein [Thermoanaerobaculia bacterium]
MPQLSRRAVLQSAPVLLATLVRCSNAVAGRARVAEAFIVDPSWNAYRPVLRGVITAVLPFDAAGFPPITLDDVEQRLLKLFPIENETRYAGLQRTIAFFDEISLFPLMPGPLLQEEITVRDVAARGGDSARIGAEIAASDAAAFTAFAATVKPNARFRDLSTTAQRDYLGLWRDSASIVKREFFGSLRNLVMITTWSMDATWPSIGYAGPLVPRTAIGS